MVPRNKGDPAIPVNRDHDIEQIIQHLNLLEERLDNMDTIITSLVEKVMGRPLTIGISCPKCGQPIQIDITSGVRLRGKE